MVEAIVLFVCFALVFPVLDALFGLAVAVVGRSLRRLRYLGVAVAVSGVACAACPLLIWATYTPESSDDSIGVYGGALCGVFLALPHYLLLLCLLVSLLVEIVKKYRAQ
jgi:hypothetical protein